VRDACDNEQRDNCNVCGNECMSELVWNTSTVKNESERERERAVVG